MEINKSFIEAVIDYHYLTQRNYPPKGFLMLVGNRYKLSSRQRTMLYRGIASDKVSGERNKKLISFQDIIREEIFIDGLNMLTTISSYLLGKPLFISTDQVLRDASELRGKLRFDRKMMEAIVLLDRYLSKLQGEIYIYLDEKVSFYQKVIDYFGETSNSKTGKKINFLVSQSVDNDLISLEKGIIATSDSEIIDRSNCRILDLARHLLDDKFQPDFLNMKMLIHWEEEIEED